MLTKVELLRRVVILCESFARNYAYYRAGRESAAEYLLDPSSNKHASLWRQVNANCLDIAVLEWCKLFTDFNGEHYWKNVVTDVAAFEAALLSHLGKTAAQHKTLCDAMWAYRSQFLAHLDDKKVMDIPVLAEAWAAVQFYHEHVVTKEGKAADFTGRAAYPGDLAKGLAQCEAELRDVFSRFPP
jgi:hypothetical protein